MKKRFTRILAAFALLVGLTIPMGMWGQSATVTFVAGTDTSTETSITKDGITITFSNGTFSRTDNYRCYANATMSVSSIVGTITEVELTCVQSNGPDNFSGENYDTDGLIGTWTNPGEGVLTAAAQVRMTQITVTYTPSGQTPTYTVTYNCNGGTSGCPENVTDIEAGTSITLASAPTKTDYIFNGWNDGTETYQASASYTVNGNVTMTAQWELDVDYLFYESFDDCNGTGGNDGQWSGTIASSNLIPDNEGWTFANEGGANKCAKFGTGSKLGSAQTPSISHTGNVTLTFKAAAWNGSSESTILNLSATSGTLSASSVTLVKGAWTNYTIEITNITTSTQIKFEGKAASNSRFFLDEVMVVEAAPTPYITAENVSIAYDAEEGTINYTINNPVEGGSIVASCDAEWIEVDDTPQTDAEGSIDFICAPNSNFYAHSATVTLTYTYGDSKATVTKDITVTQALDPDANGSTAEYPIMVSEAIDAIDEVGTVSNIYVGGIVSNIETEYSSQYENITFDMIDVEGNEYFLRAYRCGGNEAADVTVGDEVIVYGNLVKFGEIYEFAQGCEVVSLIHPVVPTIAVSPVLVELDAEEHDGTLDLTYESLTITDMTDFNIQFCDANGDELSEEPDWIEVLVAEQDPEIGEGYVVSYYMVENEGPDARTAYFKVYAMDDETNLVYSNLVTITQAAPVAPVTGDKYVKVTSTADLTSGQYLIVYEEGAVAFDGSLTTLDAASNTIGVVISNNEIAVNTTTTASEFTIDVTAGTIKSASGYYIGADDYNNMLKTSQDNPYVNSIDIDNEGNALLQMTFTGGTVTLKYNSASNQNRFRYYKSGQKDIQLYKKVESHTLTINGYTDDNSKTGYYLIASPVTVDPATVAGMTEGDFDLYYYDQDASDGLEWRNYEATPFNLVPGKGYLYAKKATTESSTYEFTLTGTPYISEIGTVMGWNLIGNPYATAASLNLPFYRMNSEGSALGTETEGNVNYMESVFVEITPDPETGDMPVVEFSPVNGKSVAALNLNVSQNRGNVIDNAIIRFDNGRTLSKFQFRKGSTKIYVTEGNKDYAIVRSAAEAEMPVSFRASENGTYTLAVEAENVEMNYLHLIDNLTGMDIDLLQTPSYTFEANTNDYANRFKLVFAANGTDEADESSFAFFSNGNLIVNNEGNATLQVIDINGRILSSETISGSCSKAINATTGVYMLRLINGDNVKVQKVVVR